MKAVVQQFTISQEITTMEFKTYIFIALALLLVLPLADAGLSQGEKQDIQNRPDLKDLPARQVTLEDRLDASYEVRGDGVYFKGLRQNNPFVWIDKVRGTTYHVDSERDFVENESISLTFFYNIQPDFIEHFTHSGKFDRAYFPTQWDWVNNCSGEFDCSGGWVTIEVFNIEEGQGSSTFPIGTTGPQWATQGQDFGEFNGVSSAVTNGANYAGGETEITMALWINFDTLDQLEDFPFLMGENSEAFMFYGNVSNDFNWRVDNSTTSNTAGFRLNNINEWIHVVGTYNGTRTSIYLNGILNDSNAYTGTIDTAQSFSIGSNSAFNEPFQGSIDEVLVYNRSLDQTEITALFNNYTVLSAGVNRTGTPTTDGLVLNINFDNFSVADQSLSQNNGVNTNVSFGVVFNEIRTLIEDTDYSLVTSTGLLTILNTDYTWNGLFVSWGYIFGESCPAGVNPEQIADDFGEFITGLLGFLGIIGIVLGVIWLIMYVNKLFSKGGLNDLGQTA